MKLFDLFDISQVEVSDLGLKKYICLEPRLIAKSRGKCREKFSRAKVSIVEKLVNQLCVPGHRGKKHKIITKSTGKYSKMTKFVIEALKIIEKQTGLNPVQVFVNAVINAAPRDEVTAVESGGARYPQAVDLSPTRRISIAIRHIVHGSYDKSFNKKAKISEALAQEIIAAANESGDSFSVRKKVEIEKQADAAR